jgi:copper chaperone
MKTILRSELTCPSCVKKIEKQVKLVPGVESVDVHFSTGRIVVAHDEATASTGALVKAVSKAGYDATVSPF